MRVAGPFAITHPSLQPPAKAAQELMVSSPDHELYGRKDLRREQPGGV
jgi:hypothetical protein